MSQSRLWRGPVSRGVSYRIPVGTEFRFRLEFLDAQRKIPKPLPPTIKVVPTVKPKPVVVPTIKLPPKPPIVLKPIETKKSSLPWWLLIGGALLLSKTL